MSDIEKRARELLARLQKAKRNEAGHWCDARAAVDAACDTLPQIIAALTPPEGYVLVPVELLTAIEDLSLIYEAGGDIDSKLSQVEMLAARPEVP